MHMVDAYLILQYCVLKPTNLVAFSIVVFHLYST